MDSSASVLEKVPVLSGICSYETGEVLMVSPLLEGEELLISNGDFQGANTIVFESQPASIAGPTTSSHTVDSEEEFFFDSKAWIGSDSEDEFFRLKGKGDNPGISGYSSQDISFVESPPLINPNSSQYSNQEPPPTERKKELVELFQDPYWSDLLVDQHHNVLSTNSEKELVQFFQGWSWSDQSIKDPTQNPCIVDSNERSQKHKSKSKEKKDRAAFTRCCCIPR